VKVTPSHQTLILAGEHDPLDSRNRSSPDLRPDEAVLQRLTIVAARPDDTLWYVQADYQPAMSGSQAQPARIAGTAATAPPGRPAIPQALGPYAAGRTDPGVTTPDAAVDAPLAMAAGDAQPMLRTPSGGRSRAGLYARTQNMLLDPPSSPRLDVHA
jgi:hypothetical protein